MTVDGKKLGPPPAFVELGPGDHRVVIERDGLETISRSFVMSTTRSMQLDFVMQPPASVATTTVTPVKEVVVAPPPPPPVVMKSSGPALRSKFWIPLIGVGVGGALAGVGFAQAFSLDAQLRRELDAAHMVTPTAEGYASRGETFQTLAWVGVGVAAASAAATVVFFLFPGDRAVTPVATITPRGTFFGITGVLP